MENIRQKNNRNEKRRRRRRVQRLKRMMVGVAIVILVLLIHIMVSLFFLVAKTIKYANEENVKGNIDYNVSEERIYDNIPEELLELLEKNPETEDFVLNYPLEKDKYSTENLDEYLNQAEVPLLMQWDSRWGYYEYGDNVMGLTGCGPTCLSMVAIHLLQDSSMTPIYMADFAERNGFYAKGIGTAWSFMTQGAGELGLNAQEVGLSESKVMNYLQQGYPIICVMGKGDFTDTGHFIVMIGVEDGKIKVNDPNSKERSQKLWNFEDIKYQIKNMWAYSLQ